MIIGECPYCDQVVTKSLGEAGAFSKETCQHCMKTYWLKHSRVDPKAYPLENVIVDENSKRIVKVIE